MIIFISFWYNVFLPCIIHFKSVWGIFVCLSQQLTSSALTDHSGSFSGKLLPILHLCVWWRVGGGVNWREKREEDCLERQTSQCLPTCKWPLCLFSWELDCSQHIRLLLPQHMWGQCIEVWIWYMTNEVVLHSGGAGTAELDEVRTVESGLSGGFVALCFCQGLSLSSHCVWGIVFVHICQKKTWQTTHNTDTRQYYSHFHCLKNICAKLE